MQGNISRGFSPGASTTIWIVLIAALSTGGSLAFACAAPLAAVAALAATTMERKTGLALVVTAWLSNQIVGYGLLGYPRDFNSFAWGGAIGVATVLAYLAARSTTAFSHSWLWSAAASFIAAFAVYEIALFVAGIPLGASAEAFSASVIARIFEVNLVSFAGLLLLYRLSVAASLPLAANKQASGAA